MGAVLGRFSAHREVIRVSGGRAWPPLGFGSAIWISKETENSSLYKLHPFWTEGPFLGVREGEFEYLLLL